MKKEEDPKPLKNVIHRLLNHYRLQSHYNEAKLKVAWEEVMGPYIAERTEQLFVKNEKLFISISSAPLRNEILYSKTSIIERLNAYVGVQVIADIVFLEPKG